MNKRYLLNTILLFVLILSINNMYAQTMGAVIPGAVDDIEKANQSQTFWYDNTWWGVFKDNNNKWAVWKLDNGNWNVVTETGIVGVAEADAHVNETTGKLYIMVSKGSEAFTRLSYSSGSWTEDSGFPIAINLGSVLGGDPASLAQAADGDLFIFYESNDSLKTLYSNDNGVTWTSYVIRTKMDASTLTDGIGFTYNGQGQMALFAGQGGSNKKFHFYRLPDADSPSDSANWIEEALPYEPKSDDHVNIIRDDDNNLYMIGKNGKSGPIFYLYKRNNNATWEYYTFDGDNSTRPALSINEDNDSLYVCATNAEKIEYVRLDKNNLTNVLSGDWKPIIENGSDNFNNVTLSSQILNNLSDVLVCAENETQEKLWFNKINHYDPSLPVELSSFYAEIAADGVSLFWITESEIESAFFILERSDDNIHFNTIAQIPSSGYSSQRNYYSFLDKSVKEMHTYYYRLSEQSINGKITIHETVAISFPQIITRMELYSNYPNPFNPITHITYQIPKTSRVELTVLNINGQVVKTLFDGVQPKGIYETTFDGSGLASGVYFCQLRANSKVRTQKMILAR